MKDTATYIDRYNLKAGISCMKELAEAIKKHPDLPVIFMCSSHIDESYVDYQWYYTTRMSVAVVELFNSDEWGDDFIFSEREELEEEIEESSYSDFCNSDGSITKKAQKALDAKVAEEMARLEPYWVKCLRVAVGE